VTNILATRKIIGLPYVQDVNTPKEPVSICGGY